MNRSWYCTWRRLRGKPTCVAHASSILGWSAKVINCSGRSADITVGAHSIVQGELFTFAHGGRISIGDWCYIGEGARVWSAGDISIGNRVLIAHNANVFDTLTHPLEAGARHRHFRHIATIGHPKGISLDERPVVIEDDAWIGAGAFVLRGTRIGRGAIVGAGAVVTKDVQAGAIVGGNPARVIGQAPASPAAP